MKRLMKLLAIGMLVGTAQGQEAPPNMDDLAKAFGAFMQAATNQSSTALVDFRELKALLPAALPGLKRTNARGERTGGFGMTASAATGEYRNEAGDVEITIVITDFSGANGIATMAQVGWANVEVDSEDDNGYERTLTYRGHKAMEKYSTTDKNGEMTVMVDGRFIVEVNGSGVESDQIRKAMDAVDLKKLLALKATPKS